MQRWVEHVPFTDPGKMAAELAAFGPAPEAAVTAIQGLLIHGSALERYGLPRPDAFSRGTLAVETRLAAIVSAGGGPLTQARPAADRSLGTCRDYSLLLCAAMRGHGQPARLRCGFASYLGNGPWEDHWLCEVWADGRWRRIDAQLDAVLCEALGTAFDPTDVPSDVFVTADEAWLSARRGERDAGAFGHGEARGLWFMCVNLMRDRLALADCLTSDWDAWRAAAPASQVLSAETIAMADSLAADPDANEQTPLVPWWSPS
jgi:hypothetical protein